MPGAQRSGGRSNGKAGARRSGGKGGMKSQASKTPTGSVQPYARSSIPASQISGERMAALGFEDPSKALAAYDLVLIKAREGRGKSHAACTYPAAYRIVFDVDNNARNVWPKFSGQVLKKTYDFPSIPGTGWKDCESLFDQLQHDIFEFMSIDDPGGVVLVIDSVSTIYEKAKDVLLHRVAKQKYDDENKIQRFDIGFVKDWFAMICLTAKNRNGKREQWNRDHPEDQQKGYISVIFTCREKKLFEKVSNKKGDYQWKGKWEPQSLPDSIPYNVQTIMRITEDAHGPRLVVQRDNVCNSIVGVSVPYMDGSTWDSTMEHLRDLGPDWEQYDGARMLKAEILHQLPEEVTDDTGSVEKGPGVTRATRTAQPSGGRKPARRVARAAAPEAAVEDDEDEDWEFDLA